MNSAAADLPWSFAAPAPADRDAARRAAAFEGLLSAVAEINSRRDLRGLLDRLGEVAVLLSGAQRAHVSLVEEPRRERIVLQSYFDGQQWQHSAPPLAWQPGQGTVGHVWVSGQAYLSNAPDSDPIATPEHLREFELHNLLTLPIRNADGQVLGVLGLGNKPGGFDGLDLRIAEGLCHHAAIAIENAGRLERLGRASARLEATFGALPDAVALFAADGSLYRTSANEAARELLGDAAAPGVYWAEIARRREMRDRWGSPLPPERHPVALALSGETVEDRDVLLTGPDGRERQVSISAAPVHDPNGGLIGAVAVHRDVTHLAELETERESLLAALSVENDLAQGMLENAPVGFVLLSPDGVVQQANRLFQRFLDPAQRETDLTGLPIARVLPNVDEHGILRLISRTLRSGRPTSVRRFRFDGFARGTTYWNWSLVPLSAGRRVLGVCWEVTEEVEAHRQVEAALAREKTLAGVLQDALLPQVPPDHPRLEIAVQYRPSQSEARIGGDLFDVFWLDERRVALVIADVCGKGIDAAVQTAQVRYLLRAYAYETGDPAQTLARVNAVLVERGLLADDSFVTLVFGILDIRNGRLLAASAGHEPPLLLKPSGRLRLVQPQPGAALGIAAGSRYETERLTLKPGDTLALFTDGIVEARSAAGAQLGGAGLAGLLRCRLAALEPMVKTADRLLGDLLDFVSPAAPHDDCTLLLIRRKTG